MALSEPVEARKDLIMTGDSCYSSDYVNGLNGASKWTFTALPPAPRFATLSVLRVALLSCRQPALHSLPTRMLTSELPLGLAKTGPWTPWKHRSPNCGGTSTRPRRSFWPWLTEFDRKEGWAQHGMASCAEWLSWQCGIGSVAAREKVRTARALESLPKIAEAFGEGRLSYSKVRALTRVATAATEETLLHIALNGTAEHVERTVRGFRRVQRDLERNEAEAMHERRYLDCRRQSDGSVRLEARLAPEVGEMLLKALEAAEAQLDERRGDAENAGASRAGALGAWRCFRGNFPDAIRAAVAVGCGAGKCFRGNTPSERQPAARGCAGTHPRAISRRGRFGFGGQYSRTGGAHRPRRVA